MLKLETERTKVYRLLSIFRGRQFPEYFKEVNKFAFDNDEDIRNAAITALSHLKRGEIHNLAYELISDNEWEKKILAIPLFLNNFQLGDHKEIEKVLESAPEDCDRDIIHGIVSDLVDLCEKNSSHELRKILLWIYEKSPCMNCRSKAVQFMLKTKTIRENILDECIYDGYEETRAMAIKAKKS